MDCKTARLFLHFSRPKAEEMGAAEIEDLDAHLVCCPDCAAIACTERRIDHQLGRAMRNVEVPEQLRGRLLARLATDRADWYRRWFGHGVRAVAIAAAVLLLIWGLMHWNAERRPTLDPDIVFDHYPNQRLSSAEEVREYFTRLGHKIEPPLQAKYAFLSHYGLRELPGQQGQTVPYLEFVEGKRRAVVYIVSDRQYKLEGLKFDPAQRRGYPYKLHIKHGEHQAYLTFYHADGLSLVWPGTDAASGGPS